MKIEKYLNTTKERVDNREHNIWIGISLGNKYFTKENIRGYINWALDKTKDDVLVVIFDKLHGINLEVLDSRSKLGALRRAYRLGDTKLKEIEEIIDELPKEKVEKVIVVSIREVNHSKYHDYRLEVVFNEFRHNKEFYDYICSIVKEVRKDRTLTVEKMESLAEYVLHEIPHFINGMKYKPEGEDWKTYDLIPYPGLTKLDELFIGLQNKTIFPELAKRLKITDNIAIIEAYVD